MELSTYKAFSDEMTKIAGEPLDPQVRALRADRRGEEYLVGGQIKSNDPLETNFAPKLAASGYSSPLGAAATYMPPDTYDFSQKKKPSGGYENLSDLAATAIKGGTTAAGLASLGHALKNETLKPSTKTLRWSVPAGAGIALADRLYRKKKEQETMPKVASLNSSTFSPARQLMAGGKTGAFQNIVHKGVVRPAPGLLKRID